MSLNQCFAPQQKELLVIGWPGSLQKQKKKGELWFLSSQPFRKKAQMHGRAICVFLPATSPAFQSWSSNSESEARN
jgi:hypothetical protein